jgi:hypothetical protein
MHIDARKLENGSLLGGDICFVGAGAAGISMVLEWINMPCKVILPDYFNFKIPKNLDAHKGLQIICTLIRKLLSDIFTSPKFFLTALPSFQLLN